MFLKFPFRNPKIYPILTSSPYNEFCLIQKELTQFFNNSHHKTKNPCQMQRNLKLLLSNQHQKHSRVPSENVNGGKKDEDIPQIELVLESIKHTASCEQLSNNHNKGMIWKFLPRESRVVYETSKTGRKYVFWNIRLRLCYLPLKWKNWPTLQCQPRLLD